MTLGLFSDTCLYIIIAIVLGLALSSRLRGVFVSKVLYHFNRFFIRVFTYAAFISLNDDKLTAYSDYKYSYGNSNTSDSRLSYLAAISDFTTLRNSAKMVDVFGVVSQLRDDVVSMFTAVCRAFQAMAMESCELPERHRRRLRFSSA